MTYREPFEMLFSEIMAVLTRRHRMLSFFALVDSYSATTPPTATVTRIGATDTEGPYVVAAHVGALSQGDRVVVQDITGEGGFVVAYQVEL